MNIILENKSLRGYDKYVHADFRSREAYLTKLSPEVQDILNDREYKFLNPSDITSDMFRKGFIASLKKIEPDYAVDAFIEPVMERMIMYIREDDRFLKLDPTYRFKKGLCLIGGVGTGKTTLFLGLSDILKWFNNGSAFECVTTHKLATEFSLRGHRMFRSLETLTHGRLCIDDVGSEGSSTHFGTTLDVFSDLIHRRYEDKIWTSCSTNLSRPSLKERYGDRVFSRMKEMFNFIVISGEDRRN
jgi:hypothetical protein